MFAGEGGPERTNRRFHYVSHGMPAKRLSTAFDSVTLYGEDPDARPDIYGKVGNSGVSIATRRRREEALLRLRPVPTRTTSVSMTINGPAPMMLAFFLNAADRPAVREVHPRAGLEDEVEAKIDAIYAERGRARPRYHGDLPTGNDGLGLHAPRRDRRRGARPAETYERIEADTLRAGARHGAGRHPQGGPGPEHLHLLHRVRAADDGRHPGSTSSTTTCATSTRCRSPATTSPRPARTRSRSSRSRWPTASPTSSTTSSRGMDIDDFAPEPLLLLLATAWTPSTR